MPSWSSLSHTTLVVLLTASPLVSAWNTLGPVQNSSFTWFADCMPDKVPACGPSMKASAGKASAAANKVTFLAGGGYHNGAGQGCGQCWHLQAQNFVDNPNGKKFGSPVVVRINDECTDPSYCDQKVGPNGQLQLNSGYHTQVHFDLCVNSGAADQFFGNRKDFGRLTGLAQQVDCAALDDGVFGSGAGILDKGSLGNGHDMPKSLGKPDTPKADPPKSSPSTTTTTSARSSSTFSTKSVHKDVRLAAVTQPTPVPQSEPVASSPNEADDECEWEDEL